MHAIRPFLWFLLILLVSACESSRPFYHKSYKERPLPTLPDSRKLEFTVFLIGDAGAAAIEPQEPNLRLLEQQLKAADKNSAIVFLGDNIYPSGLVLEDDDKRTEAERWLDAQLAILKDFKGRPFFIPGNHDWNRMSAGGREALKRQEDYIESYRGNTKVFYPKDGCGDPKDIELSEHLTLILMDSQWWLHPGDYEFYQANFLGRRTNLRGYRGERFGGDKTLYANAEARLKLFKIPGFVLPFEFGVLGFYDTGRVWHADDPGKEEFEQWHPGWGGGVFLSPYDMIILSGTYTKSEESNFVEVKLGFFY